MNNIYFEVLLNNVIKKCEGYFLEEFSKDFSLLYPFTTENISGYINYFDLKDKSLLTVGSSGDQLINAILFDAKKVTLFDTNPYSKFYIYLKIAAILELKREELLNFLRYHDYPRYCQDNKNVFKKEIYKRLKGILRILDYESYLVWDELMETIDPIEIRKNLFYYSDEEQTEVIIGSNPYLQSEIAYQETKEKLKKAKIKFQIGDIINDSLEETYDNIWLSNIATHLIDADSIQKMVNNAIASLNKNGKLLISCLYETSFYQGYQEDWSPIYDFENREYLFPGLEIESHSIMGVKGLLRNESRKKDAILIYQKK